MRRGVRLGEPAVRAGAHNSARNDPWSGVTADIRYRHLMLGLRRFLTDPMDGPRLRGVVRRGPRVARTFVDPVGGFPTMLAVDITEPDGLTPVVTVLREIATKPYLPRTLPAAPPDEFAGLAVDATAYVGWVGARAAATADDCLDAVLGDIIGDPTWHVTGDMPGGAAISSSPGQAGSIVGYIRTDPDRLRLYLARRDLILGVDVLVTGRDGRPQLAGPWLADLARADRPRLDRLLTAGDSYCDHTVDLTDRT
jgi:hypothetical protein